MTIIRKTLALDAGQIWRANCYKCLYFNAFGMRMKGRPDKTLLKSRPIYPFSQLKSWVTSVWSAKTVCRYPFPNLDCDSSIKISVSICCELATIWSLIEVLDKWQKHLFKFMFFSKFRHWEFHLIFLSLNLKFDGSLTSLYDVLISRRLRNPIVFYFDFGLGLTYAFQMVKF